MQPADREEQQERKVFVGGVPQDVDSDKLTEFFSNYEGFKKASVQKHREPRDAQQPPPHSLHRGFGWVEFWSLEHVDKLLGKGQKQRYLLMDNGRRIEVKRALAYCRMSHFDKTSENPQLRGAHRKSRSGTPSIATPSQGLSAPASPCKHVIEAHPPQSPWGRSSWSGPPEMGKMRQPMMPMQTMPQPMPMCPSQAMPAMPEMYSCPSPYTGCHSPFGGASPSGGPGVGFWMPTPSPMPQASATPTYHDHQVTGSQPWMSPSPMGEATQHRMWSTPIPEDAATTGLPHTPSPVPDMGFTTPEDLAARIAQNPQMAKKMLKQAMPDVYEE